ncbi:MAG: histidine phosphatase family protein [Minisyncoccia bacterium]
MIHESNIEKMVYFVRHGQSTGNITPVFQSPDSPLSEKGKEQAERIAERISKISFDALISSPYPRAKQTAEVIAKAAGKEPEFSDLFVERMKPTSVNGKTYEDKEATALWREWERSLYITGMRAGDGENYDDHVARADRALEYLAARPEKSLVVVTHGYFLRTIVARTIVGDLLSGELLRRFQRIAAMENTGISVLRFHGGFEEEPTWRFWIYNDHSHLG